MGVTSLWPLLAPSARPTPLPTLNRKRLAVDASIWIYQFLKAVRDKEGNALRNSHVVGFFRRICKLLYFGIKPVFVFDGGAPVLKRQTVLRRRQRREGKVVDAARTAGKMLAVQMKRRGEEEEERRNRNAGKGKGREVREDDEEAIPDDAELVYVGEMGMSSAERNKNRSFRKTDAYHLPELANGIEGMGQPNDPRIMSTEELEDYARQFHDGEDVNLYDFSKIDFNGDFFMSLPAGDRYNILNAARLRSRMRMGYGQEQLDQMYPNKMDFSRFQIARVMERNELTQRLMNLNGMNDDLPGVGGGVGGGRIAGERGREYVLVKNEGVEGGYVLGVVGGEKGAGERNKPIDVDAVPVQFKDDSEEEEEFEDVPVEGLNRLPNVSPSKRLNMSYRDFQDREIAEQRKRIGGRTGEGSSAQRGSPEEIPLSQLNRNRLPFEDPDSLFVSQYPAAESSRHDELFDEDEDGDINRAIALSLQQPDDADLENSTDEEEHLGRAIAMSLRKQHGQESEEDETDDDFEDVPMPAYEQKAVEATKPISKASGGMIAHMVNNRANAAVVRPTEKEKEKVLEETSDSDSEMDMQAALAKARRQKAPDRWTQPAPVAANQKNPFDGPLPFESLGSIFKRKPKAQSTDKPVEGDEEEKDMEGGFEREPMEEKREPIPWMAAGDIRDQVEVQRKRDQQLNAEDREMVDEEEMNWRRRNAPIVIESEDEDGAGSGSDVEIVDRPVGLDGLGSIAGDLRPASHAAELSEDGQPSVESAGEAAETETLGEVAENIRANPPVSSIPSDRQPTEVYTEKQTEEPEDEEVEWSESDYGDSAILKKVVDSKQPAGERADASTSKSPSPEFEDVAMAQPVSEVGNAPIARAPSPILEDVEMSDPASAFPPNDPATLTGMELTAEERATIDAEFDDEPSTSNAQPATELTAQEQASIDAEFDALSSDDEELMASLALEAETHAQFASTLNNRTDAENQASYERELKALRNQQKKDRRDADEVTTVMISECQALLRLFGLPYITAPMEAEAQCAELVNLGLVDGVVTDDCDIFLFGGTRVYKNMFNSNKYVECYLASDIEKELSLSRDQLIAIAHLLGSDYTEGLPGVGPVTAIEILSEFPSKDGLEEFREWFTSIQRPHAPPLNTESSTFRKKFRRQQATKLFLPTGFPSKAVTEAYWKPEVDKTPEAFQWGVPDLEKLRDFLMATIGWSQERTDEVLVPVIRDMNRREQEGTQSNITRFFDGAVGAGASGGAKGNGNGGKGSKRMMDAVGRLKARKRAKKDSNPLAKTYAEVGIEWAKKNDIGWTEREQAKLWGKGGAGARAKGKSARGRKRVVEQEDDEEEEGGEEEEEEGEEEEVEEVVMADNEIDGENIGGEDGDDDDDVRTGNGNGVRNGKGKGQQGKGKSKGQGKNGQGRAKQNSRKRAKV